MSRYAYERLAFLDNSFLIMEGPTTPMHVAGTATYEVGSLRTPEGGAFPICDIRGWTSFPRCATTTLGWMRLEGFAASG